MTRNRYIRMIPHVVVKDMQAAHVEKLRFRAATVPSSQKTSPVRAGLFALGARLSMFQSDGKDHLPDSSV